MNKRERERKDYLQAMYVVNKNKWNMLNDNITEEQHEAIQAVCEYRHWMHVHATDIVKDSCGDIEEKLEYLINSEINDTLTECGLGRIEGLMNYDSVYTSEMYDEDIDGEYDEYIQENFETAAELREHNDKLITKYLENIDSKYGTEYAPTGMSRRIL